MRHASCHQPIDCLGSLGDGSPSACLQAAGREARVCAGKCGARGCMGHTIVEPNSFPRVGCQPLCRTHAIHYVCDCCYCYRCCCVGQWAAAVLARTSGPARTAQARNDLNPTPGPQRGRTCSSSWMRAWLAPGSWRSGAVVRSNTTNLTANAPRTCRVASLVAVL
jgi:hypothetical protein